MDKRTEQYNEITFEVFCKLHIDHAVLDGIKAQKRKAKIEVCFSALPDEVLSSLSSEDRSATAQECDTKPTQFQIGEYEINVHDARLGQALQFLSPKDRAIILLSYFLDMRDGEIGGVLDIARSTVQRRRVVAQEKLKFLLKEIP